MCNFCHDYCGDITLNCLLNATAAHAGIKHGVAITRESIFIKVMMIIYYAYEARKLVDLDALLLPFESLYNGTIMVIKLIEHTDI